MKTLRVSLRAALLVVALAASTASLATRIPGPVITGEVTSVAGVDAVTIDGHQYPIKADSPAAATIGAIVAGQTVDAVLDGPADSATTHVIAINRHNAQ